MTLRLAVDTATDIASVAVGDDDVVLGEVVIGRRRSGAALVPATRECLRIAGVSIDRVESFVVADGPGSFTGLRIGWATIHGFLAESLRPVFTAPSLMGLAWAMAGGSDEPVAAMFDALRGEVFAAIYSFAGSDVTVHTAPRRVEVGELPGLAPATPGLAVGEGTVGHGDVIRKWTGRNPVGPPRGTPRAHHLLGLACLHGAVTAVPEGNAFEPNYGRIAEAQARWEIAHGRPLHDPPG